METITVPSPRWVLTYDRKDITTEIAPYMLQITYTDVLKGESDELEINLENRDLRWLSSWWPSKGDQLQLQIGYENEPLMNCGSFQIDEIEANGGSADTISIRGLAAGVTPALRTDNTVGYEDMSLEDIAKKIASKHGLKLTGTVGSKKRGRRKKRVTQKQETDLAFLKRLGEAEGVIFSVKDSKLVWHDQDELDTANSIMVIDRTAINPYTLRSKTAQVYKGCEVSYFDPEKKKLITHQYKDDAVTTGDMLKLTTRCESKEEAIIKAAAALKNHNSLQIEGQITVTGNTKLVAGINLELTGLGLLSGGYQAHKARHILERGGGYKTELEINSGALLVKGMKNLRNNKRVIK